jgi:hypothetical protein
MVNIADDLVRATELIRKFARDGWDHTMDTTDRDALVWLLEVAGGQHAYIRSRAFRDVVTAAYQMGRQAGVAEWPTGTSGAEIVVQGKPVKETLADTGGE